MPYMIGVDVGGTFTDFSIFNTATHTLFHHKQSSTPDDPSHAIISGIAFILKEHKIDPKDILYLAHGTTVATNALIERRGARLGLITTKGFKDLMEIGDQKRPSLYDLLQDKPKSLIPDGMRLEVEERILSDGSIHIPLNENEVIDAIAHCKAHQIRTIAVCTLFSYINPIHERKIKEIINQHYPEAYISISSDLVSEFREFPRMSTTVLNAYLGPVMKQYVENFQKSIQDASIEVAPYITQSNGSIISISETVDSPIRTAVSGPSAGVVGAIHTGRNAGFDKIITFDMGGTSADVSLVEQGEPKLSFDKKIGGYPVRIPMIDIVTVGAGGGSIAKIDEGGALKVGPQSARAIPGPACYMKGGVLPTVTDANLLMGKLNPHSILGGKMKVDKKLSQQAINEYISTPSNLSVEDAAAGILSVVNSNMVRAIRMVSVERGYDIRDFSLMAFGGAGPLHACEIAEELGITQVIFPPAPGTLCSLGLLMADTKHDLSKSHLMLAEEKHFASINQILQKLNLEGEKLLREEKIPADQRDYFYYIDCRYEKQNYEIQIPLKQNYMDDQALQQLTDDFHQEHERLYGYHDKKKNLQLVNFRMSAVGIIDKPSIDAKMETAFPHPPTPIATRPVRFDQSKHFVDTYIYDRNTLLTGAVINGPAIVEQMDSTAIIPPHWSARLDPYDNLLITYKGGETND